MGPIRGAAAYVGAAAVREGLRGRFEGLPDVHYGDDVHGSTATWAFRKDPSPAPCTRASASKRAGCDFYSFRGDKIVKKGLVLEDRRRRTICSSLAPGN